MKSKELIKSRTISYYRNTKVAPLKVSKFDILMGPVLGDKRKHAHIVMGLAKDKLITLAITHSEESLGYKNVALNDNPNKSVPNLVPVEYMLDKNQYSIPSGKWQLSNENKKIAEDVLKKSDLVVYNKK